MKVKSFESDIERPSNRQLKIGLGLDSVRYPSTGFLVKRRVKNSERHT